MTDMSHSSRETTTAADRVARVERATKESTIAIEVNLDGTGRTEVKTGLPFFDHMLTAFGQHSALDLRVHASGDTDVDAHHTVEDTAIVLGSALAEAIGEKKGIRRFGEATIPMDETLVRAIVDFSGRPYFVSTGEPEQMLTSVIGGHYATVINQHFFETLATHAQINLHIIVEYGRDPHHITEAEFKAVARAIRAAVAKDDKLTGVASTKGTL